MARALASAMRHAHITKCSSHSGNGLYSHTISQPFHKLYDLFISSHAATSYKITESSRASPTDEQVDPSNKQLSPPFPKGSVCPYLLPTGQTDGFLATMTPAILSHSPH